MAASVRKIVTSDAAAQELWRVAETDDVDELAHVLPRVGDVDARNKHGMTALMRAAYRGHERMVRALLEHGADPNLMRNDRFTALALAAFFGHTETVRILLEHGAKTEVVTRCGTSAYMWATARTFDEAARCLESHVPPVPPTPRTRLAPVPTPVPAAVPAPAMPAPAPVTTAAVAVKTLKDPPEIWDLVHEVPRSFDARSAFLSRLRSIHRGLAVSVLTGLLLSVAFGVGVLLLRDSKTSGVKSEVPTVQTTTGESVSAPSNVEVATSEVSTSQPESELKDVPANADSSYPRRVPTRQFKPRSSPNETVVEDPRPREEPVKPVSTQIEKPTSPAETSNRNKPATNLSPQLITPAQNSTPKAKVIQWP